MEMDHHVGHRGIRGALAAGLWRGFWNRHLPLLAEGSLSPFGGDGEAVFRFLVEPLHLQVGSEAEVAFAVEDVRGEEAALDGVEAGVLPQLVAGAELKHCSV